MIDPVSCVDEQIAAWTAGDMARFLACYATDGRCARLPSAAPFARGHAEMSREWAGTFAADVRTFTLVERAVRERYVVDRERVRIGTGAAEREAAVVYRLGIALIEDAWFLDGGADAFAHALEFADEHTAERLVVPAMSGGSDDT